MTLPVVSVVMPVYNSEKFLREATESILNQTFKDFEFIIIDDGSTDKSGEIIKSYKASDGRIRLIEHKQNKGLVESLNHGLSESRGQYIARMDADDISLPNRLKKQVTFLDSHSSIVVVGSWYQKIDDTGSHGAIVKNFTDPTIIDFHKLFFNPVAHPSVMFRKKEIESVGGYRGSLQHVEDFDLWSRFSEPKLFANIPEILYKYRVHHKSISANNKRLQEKAMISIILNNIRRYGNYSQQDAELLRTSFSPKMSLFFTLFRRQRLLKKLLDDYANANKISPNEKKRISQSLYIYSPWYVLANYFYDLLIKRWFLF